MRVSRFFDFKIQVQVCFLSFLKLKKAPLNSKRCLVIQAELGGAQPVQWAREPFRIIVKRKLRVGNVQVQKVNVRHFVIIGS